MLRTLRTTGDIRFYVRSDFPLVNAPIIHPGATRRLSHSSVTMLPFYKWITSPYAAAVASMMASLMVG